MLKKIASTPIKVVKHVNRHKLEYALAGLAVSLFMLNYRNLREMDEFLIEKGIDPSEFYSQDFA